MTVILMILTAAGFLIFSVIKSRKKTKEGAKMAGKMLLNTFIEVAGIMAIVGLVLAALPPELIQKLLGNANTALSTISGAIIGTVTIMPAIIAFPLAKSLYISGAHLTAVAPFLTTLTMAGLATMPVEVEHFGKRFTIVRNGLSFVAALAIAFMMGVFL
ncbi:MAG: hypothetical protein PQJ61_14070 [Spirochaetales bacterium]|uniref:Permease n=1 Tax=Candidatus Thalassospirochaeta sargassi TaxID=3119039 RepID=A0AAJ1IH85_9SPIO|nr:hypothetical protein [Spirochaetales bacterium]